MWQKTSKVVHIGDMTTFTEEIKEVDSEQVASETIYADGNSYRESIEGDVLEVEVSNQSLA